jgi:hypothetical protein
VVVARLRQAQLGEDALARLVVKRADLAGQPNGGPGHGNNVLTGDMRISSDDVAAR